MHNISSELCQEITANATDVNETNSSACKYWTYYRQTFIKFFKAVTSDFLSVKSCLKSWYIICILDTIKLFPISIHIFVISSGSPRCVFCSKTAAAPMMTMMLWVERKTAHQVNNKDIKSICWMKGIRKMTCNQIVCKNYYVLVLNCPEKDVSCLPSCGAEGSSLGNVTSQLQCASKSARF